ncbi:pyridoxamine 5'-phosphate oxidase family protein [Sphaerisporangium corydalis]|uniref:Pyridoxamine 5'-phosphate oxidase family protein n=1 Tax=Sphaerisporangium corydalis TaxID=1441875 RepID=A0ABV9EFT1_9ACTN|nr:pyridoxamine 5'-phosphate oxidase family protein [Sphaerisporangium corydalis]
MNRITTAARLEAIIGRPSALVLMKELTELDDACRDMLAVASLAGFGHRDGAGRPRTTMVGGRPGFAEAESPARIAFATDADASGAVSLVFLLPGVGETLRVNGSVAGRSPGRIVVAVGQAYIHCARAILRSRLWTPAVPTAPPSTITGGPPSAPDVAERPPYSAGVAGTPSGLDAAGTPLSAADLAGGPSAPDVAEGPLSGAGVTGFLRASPFLVVSSWDRDGGADTSPRGDTPGFVQVLDGHTLAIPDRRGNKRADTSRNLLADDRFSAAMLVPGRTEVLHVSGTAMVTDDADLLASMALGSAVPRTALVVTVERAELAHDRAVAAANLWDDAGHADAATLDGLTASATRQLGVKVPALRLLAGSLAALAWLSRRVMDAVYRRALRKEGYGPRP